MQSNRKRHWAGSWALPRGQGRLYNDLAWIWPIVCPIEDYIEEAQEFRQLIKEYSSADVETVLDLGCGGGNVDFTLKKWFNITGVDASESMIRLAKQLNPEANYTVGDIRHIRLGRQYDAVIIADAIDYMLCEDDLCACFETALSHLKPGGVFVTYVSETPDRFRQNRTRSSTYANNGIEITYVENYFDPDLNDTIYEMVLICLVRQAGQLQVEIDHHFNGIFTIDVWRNLLTKVGFKITQLDFKTYGFPAFVGLKP